MKQYRHNKPGKISRDGIAYLLILFSLAAVILVLLNLLATFTIRSQMLLEQKQLAQFREMNFKEGEKAFYKLLRKNSFYQKTYEALKKEHKYSPIAKGYEQAVHYENSWGKERTYGGNRVHEGVDLLSIANERGKIPIVSMTDGVIENIGWLKLGGYRIGIRSDAGFYYYYAHLNRYAPGLSKGSLVKAGQLIGFMGDSGYSEVEGTTGNFDVHLHLGIYFRGENGEDISLNPYWILEQMAVDVCL